MSVLRTLAPLLLLAAPVSAQEPTLAMAEDSTVVDGIAAVVGDSVVLVTQVSERLLQLQDQGMQIPSDPAALERLRRDILESLVNEQLLLQAALEDSTIAVDEERLDDIVEQSLQERIQSFGGQAALQQALGAQGRTLASYRDYLRSEARKQQLQQQYMARQQAGPALQGIAVTEEEMQEFFRSQRSQLPDRPATVSFAQVILNPQPTDSAMAAARSEAERVLELLREGEDFASLARRFSDDPGSARDGGDLGWSRRGAGFVQEFEDVAFVLRDGQVSGLVETEFGYHIIKVEKTRGAERQLRHILIAPEVTEADVERTRELARSIAEQVEAGEPLSRFVEEHGTEDRPDTVSVATDRLGQLPQGYAEALRGAMPGDVRGPLEFGPADRLNLSVLQVTDVREAGQLTYEDVKPQIRQALQQRKLQEKLIQSLRDRAYVDIRM